MAHSGGLADILWDNAMTHIMDSYYDAHSPEARELYWKQANDSLVGRYGWDAQTKSILINYDNLRYRLLPYIYSLAWKVTNEGYTIMRSLAFDFRGDINIKSIPDQYMFGPAFLVNPVTERTYSLPNSKNTLKTRKVYLPKSADWYDFWTGKLIPGGQAIDADAPIETIPLYIKAGSIVPMGPYLQYATEKAADPIEIRIYTGADAEFVLYEDENDTYNYELGKHSTIAMSWDESEKAFTIKERKGEFPGMLENRTFRIVWVDRKNGTGIEPAKKAEIIQYSGKEVKIKK